MSGIKEKVLRQFQDFELDYQDSLARQLAFAHQRVADDTLTALNKRISKEIGRELTLSQFHILQMLCLNGMHATVLAEKLRVTKQAVGQVIDELEKLGLVSRTSSTEDARVKLVQHTNKGFKVVSALIDSATELEKQYQDLFGTKNYRQFKQRLSRIAVIDKVES